MMVAEIVGGTIYGSMAVVADGWHMATHAGALGIAALAYRFARRHARDPRFTFGTGKVGELAAFSSAVILALVAALIGYEVGAAAVRRRWRSISRRRPGSRWSASRVNLASAWLLFDQTISTARSRSTITTTMIMTMTTTHGHDHAHACTIPTSAPPTCTCWPTR